MKNNFYTLSVVFLALKLLPACSLSNLLVGDISPVDQKAQEIQVIPVETLDQNWRRIDTGNSHSSTDHADRVWQSVKTSSVISLNSACRKNNPEAGKDLREITTDMLVQWEILSEKSEREFTLSGFQALETTVEGIYFGKKRKFQTIVVKTPSCVYDLIFLSSTKSFSQDLVLFQKFRDKLILR